MRAEAGLRSGDHGSLLHLDRQTGLPGAQLGGEGLVTHLPQHPVARSQRGHELHLRPGQRGRHAPHGAARVELVAVAFPCRPRQAPGGSEERRGRHVGQMLGVLRMNAVQPEPALPGIPHRARLAQRREGGLFLGGEAMGLPGRGNGCGSLGRRQACQQVLSQRALRQQAREIQRAACLGPGTRQPLAPEGLHPHHGADHVAVHVQVACMHGLRDLRHGFVDAGMHPESEPVAGGIDGVDECRQLLAPVAQHMQHGAEDLAAELAEAADLDERGRHEMALPCPFGHGSLEHAAAFFAQPGNVRLDDFAGRGVDDGADIGVQVVGPIDPQGLHGPFEHVLDAVGGFFLQAQHAQRRAPLSGRIEGGGEHVGHHLLGQRGGIHHHGVLPTRFGNQRHGPAMPVDPLCERRLQDAGHLGRAGEQHALHAGIGHQCGAHRLAPSRQQLDGPGWHPGLAQDAHGGGGDERRLLGRLGQHGIACRKRGRHLPREDGQRKIPGADAQHRAQGAVGVVGKAFAHLRRVVAQEVHRLTHLGHRIGQRLARLPHDQPHELLHA